MNKAFVIIKRSDMDHNKGQLFYTVCHVNDAGVLCNVLDPMDYPFVWGFASLEHALLVADNFNDVHSEVACRVIAKVFAAQERAA